MAAQPWQQGRLYPTGSIVVPTTPPPTTGTDITNPGFEADGTDWTLGSGVTITTASKFSGAKSARFSGTGGVREVLHAPVNVTAGTPITASCMYSQGSASAGQNVGRCFLRWYGPGLTVLRTDYGTPVTSASAGQWKNSPVSGTAPAGCTQVAIGCEANRTNTPTSDVDAFAWNYYTATAPAGLIFRSIQPQAGLSADVEPTWPLIAGVQVVDNEVIWEGVLASRVVWQARPILKTGATEPAWPLTPGGSVADGTIRWELSSRRIEDLKCPNSPYVVIDQGKVYMGDDDIVAFSATNNPFDWSTPNDAGYLAFGLGKGGSNPIRAMGTYRGNLLVWNSEIVQVWQIDPDPALNNRIDSLPIGSTYHWAYAPVSNDGFFLAAKGVRTVGVAASSTNLAAGDVGLPVDPLIQASLKVADAAGKQPLATYMPAMGQYWLAFEDAEPPPDPGVFTPVVDAGVGYQFFSVVTGSAGRGTCTIGADSVVTTARTAEATNTGTSWLMQFDQDVRVRITCQSLAAAGGASLTFQGVPNSSPTPTVDYDPSPLEIDIVASGGFPATLICAGIIGAQIHNSQFLIEARPL